MYSVLVVTLQQKEERNSPRNLRMIPSRSLHSSMNITPSLRRLNMRLLSSPPTSPISDSLIPGKGQHNSSLHISRRNYVYWIAWWKNLTKSLRPHALFSCNKQSNPFLTSVRFMSWTLFGIKKTGSFSTLSYQSCYDLLKGAAYHHGIVVNSAVK